MMIILLTNFSKGRKAEKVKVFGIQQSPISDRYSVQYSVISIL